MIRGLLALVLLLVAHAHAGAQTPAELRGRVLDGTAGVPLAGVHVELTHLARSAVTDAAGAFALRGIAAGEHEVRLTRYGYADTTLVVTLVPAAATAVHVALRALPAELPELRAVGAAAAGSVRIDRETIARSGARTAGDVVANVAGVVVRRDGAGAAETVRVRGSDPSAVLVLVDGVAINDPVTGVADLGAIPASSIASLELLPGARSARWGPRAEAGVILVRTRRLSSPVEAELSAGSLGGRGARLEVSGTTPIAWQAGASWHALDGAFGFSLPAEAGGGSARRVNADVERVDAFASAVAPLARGELRVRAAGDVLERGLPGKSFAPAAYAREETSRARVLLDWQQTDDAGGWGAHVAATTQRMRFHDAAPPIGLAYDDTTDAASLDAAVQLEHTVGGRVDVGAGADGSWQRVESTRLVTVVPDRWAAGAFVHGATRLSALAGTLEPSIEARVDRDPTDGGAIASHALTLRWTHAGTSVQVAHRSSFSPPGLDDQFFRDAVGVEPNPSLRAERVPSEVAIDLAHTQRIGPVQASITAAAYAGDVRDMIVWAPDYRFIWSPRNVDVRRRGAEIGVGVEGDGVLRSVRASWSYLRIAYADVPGDVQLEYRPRHTASLSATSTFRGWTAGVEVRHTGTRYPAAARVNALRAFRTVAADLARSWVFGGWDVRTSLHVDRIFDTTDALIFGFPEPGRAAELRINFSRDTTTGTDRK